eukprot:GEMP01047441.1.p1 GENE.GEMP01047441.1~~GEMP01047441.1.p1  ORF type:complete len:238 (+),score=60.71 GEMP01047441.1:37-714(+)
MSTPVAPPGNLSPGAAHLWAHIEQHPCSTQSFDLTPSDHSTLPTVARHIDEPLVDGGGTAVHECIDVLRALFFFGIGGIVESHDLITPFTVPVGTNRCPPQWADTALWIHALCHRREGHFEGKFGAGWSNASFWSSQLHTAHPVEQQLLRDFRVYVSDRAGLRRHEDVAALESGTQWQHTKFLDLCKLCDGRDDEHARELGALCEWAQQREVLLLLAHCYHLLHE